MDYYSFSLFPNARLPPKFKMPNLDKFDGTDCPKSHLKMYMRAMQPLTMTEGNLIRLDKFIHLYRLKESKEYGD